MRIGVGCVGILSGFCGGFSYPLFVTQCKFWIVSGGSKLFIYNFPYCSIAGSQRSL